MAANDNVEVIRGTGDVFRDLGIDVSRCDVTKNLVGTDTWREGGGCMCIPCQVYRYGDSRTAGQIAVDAFRRSLVAAKDALNG